MMEQEKFLEAVRVEVRYWEQRFERSSLRKLEGLAFGENISGTLHERFYLEDRKDDIAADSQPQPERRCGTCEHAVYAEGGWYACHRYPDSKVKQAHMWCGEWKAKVER